MLLSGALPTVLFFLFALVAQTSSQAVSSTNLTAAVPIIPATTWHPPNTITTITLIQKQPFRRMSSSRLFHFMLTARIELQIQAQLAGGMYLPLQQPFEKYGVGFGLYIAPQEPRTTMVAQQLRYTDVENAFTAIERQLYLIGYGEARFELLRWGMAVRTLLGSGLVGLQQSVSMAVNGTGLAMGEGANITAVDGASDRVATA